jgi:hypothetical protein
MQPPNPSRDLGTADVALLINPSRARLWNETDDPIEIGPRPDVPEDARKLVRTLTIPPRGYEERRFAEWEVYAVDDALATGKVRRVVVEPFVIVSNKTARRIWMEPGPSHASGAQGLIIPAFGTRRIGAAALRDLDFRPWVEQNLVGIDAEPAEPDGRAEDSPTVGILVVAWLVGASVILPRLGWTAGTAAFWFILVGGFMLVSVLGLSIGAGWRRIGTVISSAINLIVLVAVAAGIPLVSLLLSKGETAASMALTLPTCFRLVLTAILGLLPGLLYFQFERQRVAQLRERFFREIMLLNPNIRTLDDARIMYGASVDEVSGSVGADSKQFWLFGRGRPILISTLLIAMGWMYVYQDGGDAKTLREALTITQDTVAFAFLGAYFFTVQLLFRRYARGDLSPKVYSHITVRIACAFIAAWLLGAIPQEDWKALLLPIAFLSGVVPETAVALARDAGRKVLSFLPSLDEAHPITDLEGVNLYDRVRLLEEGVENVENLAHHDMVELMLRSRLPTPRLVDLVDQAILYLHVRDNDDGGSRTALKKLRGLGLRTASDLVVACENLDGEGTTRPKREQLLGVLGPEGGGGPRALEVILRALEDDEWFDFVFHWRQQSQTAGLAYTLPYFTSAKRSGEATRPDGPVSPDVTRAALQSAV